MTTGDAGVLREAAALMRERAQAATPGRWRGISSGYDDISGGTAEEDRRDLLWVRAGEDNRSDVVSTYGMPDETLRHQNIAHIAAFASPAVALAVADWLDHEAVACGLNRAPFVDETHTLAHAVAAAYLNGGSP